MENYLTVEEAAALLRVRPNTLRVWIMRKKIRVTRAGRRVLIPASSLEEFLQ